MPRRHFSTRLRRQKQSRKKILNNIVVFLIVLIPIYPAFGSYMQDYTGAIVRGQYDKSNILDAYDGSTGVESSDIVDTQTVSDVGPPPEEIPQEIPPSAVPLPVPKNTPNQVDTKRSLYISHTVSQGDTLGSIALKYDIPIHTLKSVNSLKGTFLSLHQKILIPRINGVQYEIQKGDTAGKIGEKFGIKDINTLFIANDMKPGSVLTVGKRVLIPNPTKDPNKVATVKPAEKKQAPIDKVVPVKKTNTVVKNALNIQKTISYGGYSLNLKVDKGCRSFVWGNCTCFVAKYKNVSWRGNAKDWLRNANKQGVPTGKTPKPGAIIVYHGPGFPPAYGHVGIVMEIGEEGMVIKDMNYRALNEVTTRRESFNNPAIIGYIYVD